MNELHEVKKVPKQSIDWFSTMVFYKLCRTNRFRLNQGLLSNKKLTKFQTGVYITIGAKQC